MRQLFCYEPLAQSEVEIEDPLQARRIESPDAYGIGALFGDHVE
jgi:hypothetical protein